jgi:hypothetical protein
MKLSTFKSVPAYSFGAKRESTPNGPRVGPGDYEYRNTFGSGRKSKIGNEARGKQINNGVPGPGQYETSSRAGNGYKGTLTDKSPRLPGPKSTTPGPGHYYDQQKHSTLDRRYGKSSKDQRFKSSVNNNPGPG